MLVLKGSEDCWKWSTSNCWKLKHRRRHLESIIFAFEIQLFLMTKSRVWLTVIWDRADNKIIGEDGKVLRAQNIGWIIYMDFKKMEYGVLEMAYQKKYSFLFYIFIFSKVISYPRAKWLVFDKLHLQLLQSKNKREFYIFILYIVEMITG